MRVTEQRSYSSLGRSHHGPERGWSLDLPRYSSSIASHGRRVKRRTVLHISLEYSGREQSKKIRSKIHFKSRRVVGLEGKSLSILGKSHHNKHYVQLFQTLRDITMIEANIRSVLVSFCYYVVWEFLPGLILISHRTIPRPVYLDLDKRVQELGCWLLVIQKILFVAE